MRFSVERDVFADATGWAARHLPSRPGLSPTVLAGILLDVGAAGRVPATAAPGPRGAAQAAAGQPADPAAPALIETPLDDTLPGTAPPPPAAPAAAGGAASPTGSAGGTGAGGGLTVCAFDSEVAVRAVVAAAVDEPGRVLVPGRLLADIVRSLPAATVEVTVDGDRLVLRCGSVRFTVPLMDVEEYPELPGFPAPIGEVDTLGFAAAVGQVAPAAGRDETVPVLTTVRMEISGRGLTLAATDRYRLAVRGIPWQPTVDDVRALAHVPARVLAEVARTPTSASLIAIGLDADYAAGATLGLAAAGRQTIVRLVEGKFPNYRRLLPDTAALTVTAQTAMLAAAVRRVAVVATRTAPLRCTFSADQVVAEAGDGSGAQASETIAVEYAGPELSVLFNPTYLLDGLAAVEDDQATIGFVDADPVQAAAKPVVLTGKDSGGPGRRGRGPADEGAYRYLLMPIRIGAAEAE